MIILDLFSGTGSVEKAYPNATVISVDINPKYKPTHCVDILDFNYKQYESFDIIWASPNCKDYSILKQIKTIDRYFSNADKLVKKVIEIIEYFKPKKWFIENPWTGYLKSRPFMQHLNYYRVDYCQYRYGPRKATAVWTNITDFKPLICNRKNCKSITNNKHPCLRSQITKYEDRIAVPVKLLQDFNF